MIETRDKRCRRYRRRILEVTRGLPAAHIASAFSCLEIVDCLYHDLMGPEDTFIMSKGHGCLAQYVVLEDLRKLPRASLDHFCRAAPYYGPDDFPRLGGHPSLDPGCGIAASTGSLGHGLGIGVGIALGERLRKSRARVFVLVSDGEMQEGSTWEAAAAAANLQLGNLAVIIDNNDWNGMSRLSDELPASLNLSHKLAAFGFSQSLCGHGDSGALGLWLRSGSVSTMPRAAICRTVKGKGVSFIEAGMPGWHYRGMTDAEFDVAMRELGDA